MAVSIKIQSTAEKQQFPRTNKMLDYLISRLENLKTLMELKAEYFDEDWHAQETVTHLWRPQTMIDFLTPPPPTILKNKQ